MSAETPAIAVALRYDEGAAPIVTASGRGDVARAIVETAEEAGVPVDNNPPLAQTLAEVPLDEPIPEALYRAVAEVIGWVLSNGASHKGGVS